MIARDLFPSLLVISTPAKQVFIFTFSIYISQLKESFERKKCFSIADLNTLPYHVYTSFVFLGLFVGLSVLMLGLRNMGIKS
jgi:hypothetical protein